MVSITDTAYWCKLVGLGAEDNTMKKYDIYAIARKDSVDGDSRIKLNSEPIDEEKLEKALSFYLMRGEWLDRGYFLSEEEVK